MLWFLIWVWFSISSFIIVCVKNGYPKGLKSNCKRSYSCVLLAKRKMCGKKYSKAMSRGCNAQITQWSQNQLVRNFCKLSCNKCTRKYYVVHTMLNILWTVIKYSWVWKSLEFWIHSILGSRQVAERTRNLVQTETTHNRVEMKSPGKDEGNYIELIARKTLKLVWSALLLKKPQIWWVIANFSNK